MAFNGKYQYIVILAFLLLVVIVSILNAKEYTPDWRHYTGPVEGDGACIGVSIDSSTYVQIPDAPPRNVCYGLLIKK